MNNEINPERPIAQPVQVTSEPVVVEAPETDKIAPLMLSEAIDVRELASSFRNTKIVKLSDLDLNEFKFGEPCPLKLADGIFLKDGETVTRYDTVTFSPVITEREFASDLRRKLENARKPEARIAAIARYLSTAITHIGDVPIADAAKLARTRDNKPESIFAGTTTSDVMIAQIAARIYVNPDKPFDYAIAVNDCGCENQERLYDVREVDSETGKDVTELHSIKDLVIRYSKKVQELNDLPLYGIKLPDSFEIYEAKELEVIDELYFRPMLLREFAAYFESSNQGKKGFKELDTATQLKARVAAMPQSNTFCNNKQGEIFESRYYDRLSLDSVAVLEQALIDLTTGFYNGITQNLAIKFDCSKCPGWGTPKKLDAPINWIDPYDFIYGSVRPRTIPRN